VRVQPAETLNGDCVPNVGRSVQAERWSEERCRRLWSLRGAKPPLASGCRPNEALIGEEPFHT
jgi:hypothetical protein